MVRDRETAEYWVPACAGTTLSVLLRVMTFLRAI